MKDKTRKEVYLEDLEEKNIQEEKIQKRLDEDFCLNGKNKVWPLARLKEWRALRDKLGNIPKQRNELARNFHRQ